jgi:hypothetical protein
MLEMWVAGLVLQVVNQPADVRIGRWLYATYPGLRSEQVRALKQDAQVALQGLSPDVERLTSPTVFRLSNAINYAYLSHVGRIIRGNYRAEFLDWSLYDASQDEGLTDLEVVSGWVERSRLGRLFLWVEFEDTPESFLTIEACFTRVQGGA